MHRSTKLWAKFLPFVLLALLANPAAAHHAMGSTLPTQWWQGLLSGFAHPIIGLDHLLFVIAIGLVSIKPLRGVFIPAFFVIAALIGTGLHLQQVDLPLSESVIALSVVAIGFILAIGHQARFAVLAGLAAIAGLFHGYAYGESIIGAGMTPLIWYLIGFSAIQFAIALIVHRIGTISADRFLKFERFYGIAACAIGAFFFAQSLS